MTVAPPDTDAPRPRPVTALDDRAPQADAAVADAFAVLLAMAQSGLGRRAAGIAPTLRHQSARLAAATPDARHRRLEQMTQQANQTRTRQQSSRLQDSSGPKASELGPRAERLAAEKQDLADQVAHQTKDPAPAGRQRLTEAGTTKGTARSAPSTADGAKPPTPADAQPRNEATAGRPGPDQGPAKQMTSAASRSTTDTSVSPLSTRAVPANETPPAAGPGSTAGARVAGQPETVATQVARILTARNAGADSPRAVSGAEQPTGARATTGPTNPGQPAERSGRHRGATSPTTHSPDTRTADSTRQSDFERLVRSVRLNVGVTRSTARMCLEPPELGRIQIEARVDGQRIELLARTETSAASELLRARVTQLQAALEQHGLRIERFEVAPATPSQQQNPTGGDATTSPENTNQPPPGQDAEGGLAGDEHEPTASADRPTEANDESEGRGDEQLSPGDQPALAALGAARETRLDVRV